MAHAAALPYAMCVPFGRGEERDAGHVGLWLRAAAGELISPEALPDCLLDWARVFA